MSESVADRVKAVREALGLKQPEFAARLMVAARQLGVEARYDNTMVSKMELGTRYVGLLDGAVIAAVDPERRGLDWLALGPSGSVLLSRRPIGGAFKKAPASKAERGRASGGG